MHSHDEHPKLCRGDVCHHPPSFLPLPTLDLHLSPREVQSGPRGGRGRSGRAEPVVSGPRSASTSRTGRSTRLLTRRRLQSWASGAQTWAEGPGARSRRPLGTRSGAGRRADVGGKGTGAGGASLWGLRRASWPGVSLRGFGWGWGSVPKRGESPQGTRTGLGVRGPERGDLPARGGVAEKPKERV